MNSERTDDERGFDSELTGGSTPDRRTVLRSLGSLAAAGLLAGCTSIGNDGDGGDGGSGGSVDDWLSDTGNYDGVVDRTGEDAVTVEVGAKGNNGANAFAPAAIEISPGTEVTWKWVSGYHNVVAENGEFDSGSPEQNATFRHTFESPGTSLYYCDPHESLGMKGAVVVAGGEDAGTATDGMGSS
ncbi:MULTISPECIES: halocyanin domain-containing protein [Halorussus]|uniref:halocyanin domain-containing protein n=1 Tax=Halorussus TaxID=1070314 RepID=UPI00209DED19|nr:halocyanin domain-containing protein [Halorussus vallis]USZ74234.1 halocyanin domain-containing protein [Halorussus vallis]